MSEKKNNILIVDDESSNIRVLKDILSSDYRIYASTNGQDAIETALEFLPDVILLDIIMPDMDGYEVIAALKNSEKTRDIPIILITGLDSIEAEEKGLTLGAADYIMKPFHPLIVKLRVSNQIKLLKQLRQQAMEQQFSIVENMPNLILSITKNAVVEYANPAVSAITGFTKYDLMKDGLGVIFEKEMLANIKEKHIPDAIQGKIVHFEVDIIRKDGIKRILTVSIFRTGENNLGVVFVDLTKMRELEIENEKVFLDGLTNIYNRRFFDESIARIFKSSSRANSPLSLMMIDIDFFKNYNDAYGHSAGDDCLKAVADILKKGIPRACDFLARYGGEEFVVVLPNTDKNGAINVAERFLAAVQTLDIPHKTSETAKHITFSIGITTGNINHTHTAEDFIKRADEMLYKAKLTGKNRHCFAAI
ncbi:MAG: diguanylate cyclase [Chitinivibrionia bacterium]|nr:diguanylate cyclase [Chitinivibrionia bacterium]